MVPASATAEMVHSPAGPASAMVSGEMNSPDWSENTVAESHTVPSWSLRMRVTCMSGMGAPPGVVTRPVTRIWLPWSKACPADGRVKNTEPSGGTTWRRISRRLLSSLVSGMTPLASAKMKRE